MRPPRRDDPPIDDDVTGREFEPDVLRELESLPPGLAEIVGKHLVMAAMLVDDDPQEARRHTEVAHRLAARLACVREACALTAYELGDYAEALREFRAVRRMTGDMSYAAYIADCERGLGRPDKALEVCRESLKDATDPDTRVELLLVASGARADLGQEDAAVVVLQVPELRQRSDEAWAGRLRFGYAEALLRVGRTAEALEWFGRAAEVDVDDDTGARERLAELRGEAGPSGPTPEADVEED